MKKSFLWIVLSLISSLSWEGLVGQVIIDGKKNDDYVGHFYLMSGIKTLKIKPLNASFFFQDESQTPDSVSVIKEFKSGNFATDILCIGGDFDVYKNISIYGQIDFYFQRAIGANFNLGGCYNIYTKKFIIKPNLAFDFGAISYSLATLKNTGNYVTINKKEFVGKEVTIGLDQYHFDIKPGIAFMLPLSKLFSIRGDFGYNFNLANIDRLSFSGFDYQNNALSTDKKLSDNGFSFNNEQTGKRISELPISRNGVFIHLGIALNLFANHNSVSSTEPINEEPKKQYTTPKRETPNFTPPPRESPRKNPGY